LSLASGVSARFDRISDVYDETREPLSEEALDRVAEIFRRDGIKRIIEAGVGTGRVAIPLQKRGFDIAGLDLSAGMLSKARSKGADNLVRGDANNPPFRNRAFDAALLAHVLHLVEDPFMTFERLSACAKNEVVVLLARPLRNRESTPVEREEIFKVFREAASELGIDGEKRWAARRERFVKQYEFLDRHPPSETITVQEVDGTRTLREYLSWYEKRAFGFADDFPEDELSRVIERVKQTVDLDKVVPYHRVAQMLIWRMAKE